MPLTVLTVCTNSTKVWLFIYSPSKQQINLPLMETRNKQNESKINPKETSPQEILSRFTYIRNILATNKNAPKA